MISEYLIAINDKDTLEEGLTFVRNEKGRAEAQIGAHDDLIMALAIAYRIREQVSYNIDPIKIYPEFNFETEKEKYDYGEEIVVV